MLVDRSQRLKAEVFGNFLEAGRVPLPIDMSLQIAEDFTLAFGQRHPMSPLVYVLTE
jgi:hypothetical protein